MLNQFFCSKGNLCFGVDELFIWPHNGSTIEVCRHLISSPIKYTLFDFSMFYKWHCHNLDFPFIFFFTKICLDTVPQYFLLGCLL